VDGGGIYLFLLWRVKHFRALGDLNLMEKKRFSDDPRIEEEEKSWANTFSFFASVRFPMRLVLTRTQGARSRRLCLLCLLTFIYIYSPPHRNVFNRYVQSRVKGGGVGGKEAGYRGVVGWPRKFPTQLSIPNPDTSIIFDPLPVYLSIVSLSL
jgi:hypothetical protein